MLSNIINDLPTYLLRIPVILIAISVHETAHALVSYWLGDPTARAMGRISMNPLRHLNIPGVLCMVLLGFGWASPVIVNPKNYKNEKLGEILVSIAGPISNLLLGIIGAILFALYYSFGMNPLAVWNESIAMTIYDFLIIWMTLNISLFVFNLIPIPPLDGSHLITVFLPQKWLFYLHKYSQYIMIGFFVLIYFDPLNIIENVLNTSVSWICNNLLHLLLG